MIYTWFAEVSALMRPEVLNRYYHQLPLWRRKKADRLRYQQDKALSIGAWALYERARREAGVSEGAVFNLSHSGKYVLCSIDTSENVTTRLGCDLEVPKNGYEKIAGRFFTKAEQIYIQSEPSVAGQRDNFFRLWVLKESFIKATRQGISLGFTTFEIGFNQNNIPVLADQPKGIGEAFYFKEYIYSVSSCRIAVCSSDRQFAKQMIICDLE